jgi:hypothetical protein
MAIEAGEHDPHYDEDLDRFRAHRLLIDPDYQSAAIDDPSETEEEVEEKEEHKSPSNQPPQKKNKRSKNKNKKKAAAWRT